jgi:hypothetical protein
MTQLHSPVAPPSTQPSILVLLDGVVIFALTARRSEARAAM